jgi:hypothetical protein
MIDQTDELLRAGMERFAAGTTLPPGLATRAIRHRRRRGIAAAAGTAGTVAAAGAVIAAVAVPGSGPVGTAGHAETAAYVVNHAESALASTGSQPLIENARVTGASGFGVSIGPRLDRAGQGRDWRIRPLRMDLPGQAEVRDVLRERAARQRHRLEQHGPADDHHLGQLSGPDLVASHRAVRGADAGHVGGLGCGYFVPTMQRATPGILTLPSCW